MIYDLQKANVWKRIAAGIFDLIMLVTLCVGVAFLFSAVFGYDSHNETFEGLYDKYENSYGVDFNISNEAYDELSDEEKLNYDEAYKALIYDETVLYEYEMVVNLSILITTLSILVAYIALEFIVPMLFGNGQTLGKKIFGIGVIRTDGVKLSSFQLFVRTILGKYTIETMIPVFIVMMLFWGMMDLAGAIVIIALLLTELIMITVTSNNSLIHDMLAVTVTVDISSQMIFSSSDEKIQYQKKLAAERAEKQAY